MFVPIILALIIFSAVRILAAAGSDFWLDEVFSWKIAQAASSLKNLLFEIQSDNNHFLNSAWIYLLGPKAPPIAYRAFSLLTGCLLPLMAPWISIGSSRREKIYLGLFLGSSFFLITYSSEARGYSAMIFFGFLSFAIARSLFASSRPAGALILYFWLCAVLASLSHAIYYFIYFGILVWSFSMVGLEARRDWRKLGIVHGPVMIFLVWLFVEVYENAGVGKAIAREPIDVLLSAVSLFFGNVAFFRPVGICALALLAGILIILISKKQREWIFLLTTGGVNLLVPIWAGDNFQYFSERYFLPLHVIFLLVLAWAIARIRNLYIAGILVGLLCMVNLYEVSKLVLVGRGDYAGAFAFLLNHSGSEVVTLTSLQNIRVPFVMEYYLGDSPRFRYQTHDSVSAERAPDWLITEVDWSVERKGKPIGIPGELEGTLYPPDQLLRWHKVPYRKAKVFPHYGLSGFTWVIYRKASASSLIQAK